MEQHHHNNQINSYHPQLMNPQMQNPHMNGVGGMQVQQVNKVYILTLNIIFEIYRIHFFNLSFIFRTK